jgi:hypothetical protein
MRDSLVYFQYIGNRQLTIIGPNTRKLYRFDEPGAIVVVDARDERPFSAVTVLRQVTKVMYDT